MKHTYTVESEEIADIKSVMRGPEYLACLHDIYQELRCKSKYLDQQRTTWQEIYDLFLCIVAEHAVSPVDE